MDTNGRFPLKGDYMKKMNLDCNANAFETAIVDLSSAETSEKNGEYGGLSCIKEGIIYKGSNWLVKYPRNALYLSRHNEMSYTSEPLSEYLGSHIYEMLGYTVHETILGYRRDKLVVACKDFLQNGEHLLEFRTIKNSVSQEMHESAEQYMNAETNGHVVELDVVRFHLKHNPILLQVDGVKERFYDMIVIDALINNNDRNNGNWGLIRKAGVPDRFAPVYDNGGSFNGKTPDSRLEAMLRSNDKMIENALNCISAFGKNGKNYFIKDLLTFEDVQLSVIMLHNRIQECLPRIYRFIDGLPDCACSEVRKEFYKKSVELRFNLIIDKAYYVADYLPSE